MTPALRLVPALPTDAHARRVMEWRNDPVTRAASFHTDEKRWPAFLDEYQAYFDAPVPPRFAAIDAPDADAGDRALAGFVRFRCCADPEGKDRDVVDISIHVAPEQRGRGVGTALIRAATAFALERAAAVLAEVRPGNAASSRAFISAGYVRLPDGTHDVDGTRVAVERYLYASADA